MTQLQRTRGIDHNQNADQQRQKFEECAAVTDTTMPVLPRMHLALAAKPKSLIVRAVLGHGLQLQTRQSVDFAIALFLAGHAKADVGSRVRA